MKKFYLSLFILLAHLISFGQTTETEPNDEFATANELLMGDPTVAILGGLDTVDLHKMVLNENASIYIYLEIANTGSNGPQRIDLDIYNSLQIGGEYVGNFFSTGYIMNEGDVFYDTIKLCGKAADDFFLRFKSNGDFEYKMEWYAVNSYPDEGYNDVLPYTTGFTFDIETQAGIGYMYWGNENYDTVDIYSTTLPAADYDSVSLSIRAQNNSCADGKWIKYYCYKNSTAELFASGYVGNNPSVNAYQEVFATIPLTGLQQGDHMLVKFVSNGAFGYKFKYSKLSEFEPDPEDNCCTYNALPIVENEVKTGSVGEYDENNGEYVDEYDTYRIILPQDGAVNLFVKAINDQCTYYENYLTCTVLDKYGNYLNTVTLSSWENYPACGELRLDTIKLRGFAADTFYLQLAASQKVSYNIKYQLTDSTGSDPDESYNGPITTVLPLSAGETKKGHVRFLKDAYTIDAQDIYKTTLAADANVVVYVKAIYREDYEGPNTSSNGRLSLFSSGFTDRLPSNPPVMYYTPDGVYLDTFYVCGLGKGDIYFTWNSGSAYEYEFRYEIMDSSSDVDIEPNNSFAQATLTGGGVTKKGHVNYIHNVTTDTYDFYKMSFGSSDSLVIPIQATNMSCEDGKSMIIRGYNKDQAQIFSRYLENNTNVNAGQTIFDTIKIYVTAPDTIYVRLEATDAFKYQLSTNSRLPTSNFTITGDSSVCLGTEIYTARGIANEPVGYHWSLPEGGGTLSFVDSVATIQWTASGNRRVELYLSNPEGNSKIKKLGVVVNAIAPTQVPVMYNFARTLSTNTVPAGSTCQWLKNNVPISGVTDSSYYATDAGTYTVRFVNGCGEGPVSNSISFPADVQAQTITFPHIAPLAMSPGLKVKLNATASSGLPVFYQKVSGPGSILNDTLFITGVGKVIVKALQPGDDTYSAAASTNDTITIIKGNQTLTFDPIPDQIYTTAQLHLLATSSTGQAIDYDIIAGNATMSGASSYLNMKGVGNVTVRASQNGNANYNATTPIERTFCIGVRTLEAITGQADPCLATYTYTTEKIPGANFIWTLSGGGILTTHNDTAFVQWQTPGSYTLKVKANSPCDPVYTTEKEYAITTSGNAPAIVSNMLPVNNAIDQKLPLQLSWIPGGNTVNYDLYVWDAALAQPGVPYVANISTISYKIPANALAYNKTYKWRVVAKNPCSQTPGPIQQFSLVPLPDLVVSDIQVPASANSGQTITITWKISNVGPGRTTTSERWNDAVFLSFDTMPAFNRPPQYHGPSWSSQSIPIKPLLLGTKQNVSALESGQNYTNSVTYTLPLSYSQPLYVYVITDYGHGGDAPLQVTMLNDTARAPQPIDVTLSPTPDLRVDTVFAPASTFSGSTINLTYKVKNYGVLTPVGSSWNDAVYISQDPLFNIDNAIQLNAPKTNGSYYPNASKAYGSHSTQLFTDSSYAKNLEVVIPNFIFGNYFIYVIANSTETLYEGALANNNLNRTQMQVYLTPTPKLTVNSLSLPITSASTTQPIGANWNIRNEGFTDNIEKSKGHRFTAIGSCNCHSVGNGQVSCSVLYMDNPVLGSSYWLDKAYLSTDPNGLDVSSAILVKEVTHGTLNSGLLTPDYFLGCGIGEGGPLNVHNVINPGSNFPEAVSFNVPSDLQPGSYYLYVITNPSKTVFEYPGTPQIKRSDLPITVQRPDVVVSSVTVPNNVTGGQDLTINYSVLNNGAGAVFNHIRRDKIYVSAFPSFDASAQLIETKTFTGDLPVGTPVPYSTTYRFTAATSGARYFYVHTNFDSAFKETNSTNDLSASSNAVIVAAALPNDLVVSNIQLADTATTIFTNSIIYTVRNNGTGTTAGTWIDSVYFNCNPTFNFATNNFAARKSQARAITAGGSYTDTIYFTIPEMSYEVNSCFPENANTTAYFFIKTNANNVVYEGSNGSNNITGTGSRILHNPVVDHIITLANGPETTTVGRPYPVSWTLKNIGERPTIAYYKEYNDAVYFSPDSVFNSNAVLASNFEKQDRLYKNQSIDNTGTAVTPNIPGGDYYVLFRSDHSHRIKGEIAVSNNFNAIRDGAGAAKKIHVIQPQLPDLVDSIIIAPASMASGQPLSITHRVTNKGTGASYPANITNKLWLSTDFVPSYNDLYLSSLVHVGSLLPGQSYDETVTVPIPWYIVQGNYILISNINTLGNVFETNHDNNLAFSLLSVYNPPATDLVVENILIPDTVYLGYTIDTAKWVIQNLSPNQAEGKTTDGIYLSKNNVFDSTAVLIGLQNKTIDMAPLALDSVRLAPMVNSVTEGSYNVFVRTDIQNNIIESDKDNNTGLAIVPIYVKVKELPMNVLTANTLHKTSRYYKLIIPDSLIGSTIRISLKTNDSSLVRNEMFVGRGYVPSSAKFDYRFEIPNYGNQQIVIASVTDTLYYIAFNCVSPNPPVQNVTLKAEKLPFAVLSVHTNSGGNIGNVTVKISGSLFRENMKAKLSNGTTTINASAVYFTNSTTVYATFNLQGKPLGVYDVTLIKPDTTSAVLANSFSIVSANNGGIFTGGGVNTGPGNGNEPGCDPGAASGLNSQLVVQIVAPHSVVTSWPFVIQINYNNPTNFDIPAQSRILYSQEGIKMAFTAAGVENGSTALYLELTEPGGPPGIIRAGGSGTITIHTKSLAQVPEDPKVAFTLK